VTRQDTSKKLRYREDELEKAFGDLFRGANGVEVETWIEPTDDDVSTYPKAARFPTMRPSRRSHAHES
jgi:hypothetical protein